MPVRFRRRGGPTGGGWRGGGKKGHDAGDPTPGGPPTNCICPQCGFVAPHEPSVPCYKRKCPQCGSSMARQFLKIE